jgi:hypothetical protein
VAVAAPHRRRRNDRPHEALPAAGHLPLADELAAGEDADHFLLITSISTSVENDLPSETKPAIFVVCGVFNKR